MFFFKQKTAYEMRISDWSSDVCSSDLIQNDSGAGPASAWVGAAAVAAMLGSAVPATAAEEELPISGEVSIEVHDDWTTRSDNPDDERNDASVEIETADRKSTRLNSSH